MSERAKIKHEYDSKNHHFNHTKWRHEDRPYLANMVKSFITSGESHALYDASRRLGSGNYANLGVAGGKSVNCLAWGLKAHGHQGKVYAVDTYGYKNHSMEQVRERLISVHEYVEYCQGWTSEWAPRLHDVPFKFVFIDADHSYEHVKEDFEMWSPMVEVGGEVAFHDCNLETVHRFIQEIDLTKWKMVQHLCTLKFFKKL